MHGSAPEIPNLTNWKHYAESDSVYKGQDPPNNKETQLQIQT